MISAAYCKTSDQSDVWRLLQLIYENVVGKEMPSVSKAPSGKPYFDNQSSIEFSVSHTCGAVLALLSDNPCGCDIEPIKRDGGKFAHRIATDEELSTFSFVELWTLKESMVKLAGKVPNGNVYDYMSKSILSRDSDGSIECPFGLSARTYEADGYQMSIVCIGMECPTDIVCVDSIQLARSAS